MKKTVYVDVRCLQQPTFRLKGVGRHIRTLIKAIPADLAGKFVLHGVYSPGLPALDPSDAALFAGGLSTRPVYRKGDILLNPIPLNNGDMWQVPHGTEVVRVGIVHDFIAHEYYGLVKREEEANLFIQNTKLLGRYDFLLPNSEYTHKGIEKHVGVDIPCLVTGVIVDDVFFRPGGVKNMDSAAPLGLDGEYFMVAAGDNPRKNVATALKAFGKISQKLPNMRLVIPGGYDPFAQERLRREISLGYGVDWKRVIYAPFVADEVLRRLYMSAVAVITPSHIEGFSIPVVETVASGGVVIASGCEAQRELIPEPFFDSHSEEQLAALMLKCATDPKWRERVKMAQAGAADRFKAAVVGGAVWAEVLKASPVKCEVVRTGNREGHAAQSQLKMAKTAAVRTGTSFSKPNILFVTPYPPQKTGVGDFHAASMPAFMAKADVTVLAPDVPRQAQTSTQPRIIHTNELTISDYDRVFYVIGNSPYHKFAIDLLQQNGGEVILHDSRLFEYYLVQHGIVDVANTASELLGRRVDVDEVESWAGDRRKLPIPMLDNIVNASEKIYVFSPALAEAISRFYSVTARYVPVPIHNAIDIEQINPNRIAMARQQLGFKDQQLNLCTFGSIDSSKGLCETIFALEEMRQHGLKTHMHFIGPMSDDVLKILDWARTSVHYQGKITLHGDVSRERYFDFLLAGDIGMQFRKAFFGQMSGAVTDLSAVGMWSIVNKSLGEANAVPSFVKPVSDRLEPLNIAYGVADLLDSEDIRRRDMDACANYRAPRTFENFVKLLLQ